MYHFEPPRRRNTGDTFSYSSSNYVYTIINITEIVNNSEIGIKNQVVSLHNSYKNLIFATDKDTLVLLILKQVIL